MSRPILFTKEQIKQKRKELDSCSIKIIGSKEFKEKFERFVKSKLNKSKKQVLIDILNSNEEFKNFI